MLTPPSKLRRTVIKNGSEQVAQQCRYNISSIQTLKDFQFIDEDGKNEEVNEREN